MATVGFQSSKFLFSVLGKSARHIRPLQVIRHVSILTAKPAALKSIGSSYFNINHKAYFKRSAIFLNEQDNNKDNKKGFFDEEKERLHEDQKKREAAVRTLKYTFWGFGGAFGLLGACLVYELGRPSMDEEGKEVKDQFSDLPTAKQYLSRLWNQLNFYVRMIQEPSRDKLLPDPMEHPYIQPPYTLVLELTDVLVHPDWTYQTGWRFKKRPGVDHFLEQVSFPNFEIVIYTAEPALSVNPLLNNLDPKGHIMFRLVRDSTHYVDGHHIKDLSRLNRDLNRVIVVDWNSDSVKMHRSNALIIPRWKGNDDDMTLVDLAALLKTIAALGVDDVRETMEYYSQFSDPIAAFRENRQKLVHKLEEEQDKLATSKTAWTPSFLKKNPLSKVI